MDERTQVLAAHRGATSGWRRAARHAGRSVLALASVAILGTMGYGWWAVGDVDEGTVTTEVIPKEVEEQRIPLDGAVDLLLVGIDSRTDAYGNPLPQEVLDLLSAGISDGERNTDTMILVHIPVDGTRAVAISFPRDSWVELAGDFGNHRLNSAFAYAYNDAREDLVNAGVGDEKEIDTRATVAGRKNLISTIQSLIGDKVTIDRYAEVNLASFYEITRAIGGVEVCLNEATRDRNSGANFRKGRQTVAGARALAFVRQRYGLENGDLDRIVRQQAFLGALADKVLSADMLTSPSKVRELIAAVQKSVVLSNGWELSTFAAQMSGLSSDGIDFHTIPTLGEANIGGADVIEVNPQQVARFVESLTSDENSDENEDSTSTTSSPSSPDPPVSTTTSTTPTTTPTVPDEGGRPSLGLVTVDVRNGSNTSGLAAAVRDDLTKRGFNPGEIGDSSVRGSSVIRFAPGEQSLAEYAATELGGGFELEEDAGQPAGRLWVVLGTDYQAPAGLVGDRLVTMDQPSTPSSPGQPPSASDRPAPQLNADGLNCVN